MAKAMRSILPQQAWEIRVFIPDIFGVGDAQVWNEHSVSKMPALLVAM